MDLSKEEKQEQNLDLFRVPLIWEFKKSKARLMSYDKEIIELKYERKRRASFKWQGTRYTIRNRGFWNSLTEIQNDKGECAYMQRSLRSNKMLINFTNGNRYVFKAQNPQFIKLTITTTDRKEILRYKLISKLKANMHVSTRNAQAHQSDLILLLAFGCFAFRGIVQENKFAKVEEIVFAADGKVKDDVENTPTSLAIGS